MPVTHASIPLGVSVPVKCVGKGLLPRDTPTNASGGDTPSYSNEVLSCEIQTPKGRPQLVSYLHLVEGFDPP